MKSIWKSVALVACTGLAISSAHARPDFPETEPNDTKAAANAVTLAVGDSVSGTSTGTSTTVAGAASADYYRVKTTAAPLGIYRHRLALSSTTQFQTATIRGLSQASPGVIGTGDNTAQTHSTTLVAGVRTVQWYGFGKEEEIYYRVTGSTTTLSSYTSTLATDPVVPFNFTAATIYAGNVTIGPATGNTADMDWWLYDSSLNAIPCAGMDTGPTAGVRTVGLTPGTYYLAFSSFNFANNQASCSPETFFGTVLDFPNAASLSSTSTTITNINAKFTSTAGVVETAGLVQNEPFLINWIQFTVVAAPGVVGSGSATPASVGQGINTEFKVTVTPGSGGTLDDIANPPQLSGVRLDIAQISGNAAPDWLYLVRDGISADWKSTYLVPVTAPIGGPYSLPFEVTQGGSSPSNFSGTLGVTVTAPPPPNATCAQAIALTVSTPYNGNNFDQANAIEGANCPTTGITRVKDVWFSFNPGATGGDFSISTCGTGFDTVLDLYNTTDCSASGIGVVANAVACNDDNGPACSGNTASLNYTLAANTTYLIRMCAWGSASPLGGPYTIVVAPLVPLGTCCNNTTGVCTLTFSGTCPTGTSLTGTGITCDPTPCAVIATCCVNTTGVCSVLYGGACTSTQTQNAATTCEPTPCAAIATCCVNASGVCSVLYGGACASTQTQNVATTCDPTPCAAFATCCNDTNGACTVIFGGSCPTGTTQTGMGVSCAPMDNPCPPSGSCCTGTACSVILDTNSASCTGTYTVNGVCSPDNPCFPADNCTTTDLIATVGTQSGSTVDSTTSFLITNVALCPGITTSSGGFNDVFWKFTAPATAAYTIDTCGSAFDTILSVHGGTCGTLATTDPLACNDDSSTPTGNVACTSSTLHSRIQTVTLTGGTTYYIRISAFLTTTRGAYTLNINYVTGVGSCCVSTTCSLTDAANCSGTFNAGGSCSPSPCVPSTENCCRGTTCNSITAGTCTGVVAGSNSLVVTSCGAGNALSTCCFADYNHDGIQSIDDLFLYFNAYFTASPWANVGGDGVATPTIDDLFLYINAYFSTCAP